MWQMLVGPVSDLLNTVLKRVLPPEKMSEAERAQLESTLTIELSKMDWAGVQAQLAINLEEAKSENIFKSGWRPAVGWTCGIAYAYNFVAMPFIAFFVGIFTGNLPPMPELDIGALSAVLFALLGIGGMRTYEKYKGVQK